MKTIQRKLLLQDRLYSDSDYMDCKGGGTDGKLW